MFGVKIKVTTFQSGAATSLVFTTCSDPAMPRKTMCQACFFVASRDKETEDEHMVALIRRVVQDSMKDLVLPRRQLLSLPWRDRLNTDRRQGSGWRRFLKCLVKNPLTRVWSQCVSVSCLTLELAEPMLKDPGSDCLKCNHKKKYFFYFWRR